MFLKTENVEEKIISGYKNDDINNFIHDDSIYDLNRTSEVFLITSIKMLSAANMIDLDTPMRKYIPEFEYLEKYTIRDVLEQKIYFYTYLPSNCAVDYDTMLALIYKTIPTKTLCPIDRSESNNLRAFLLKLIIERVTHIKYKLFVEEYIFKMIKMEDTSFGISKDKLDRLVPNDNNISDRKIIIDSRSEIAEAAGQTMSHDFIYSTPKDMAKFGSKLDSLLSSKNLNDFHKAVIPPENSVLYNGILRIDKEHSWENHIKNQELKYLSDSAFCYSDIFGNSFLVDPKNKFTCFIGANRLNNRAFPVKDKNQEYMNETFFYDNCVCSNDFYNQKQQVIKQTGALALQYNFFNKTTKDEEQYTRVRTI